MRRSKHADRAIPVSNDSFTYWTYEAGADMPLIQFRSKEEALRLGPLYRAAPDLLETLRNCADYIETTLDDGHTRDTLDEALAAIAKAEGR